MQDTQETFFPTFASLFERQGMNQSQLVDAINAQVAADDHPPYRHIDPLSQSTVSRILAGSFVPDADTLFRIAKFGFGLSKKKCHLLEDLRYEAWLQMKMERRTTQQMAVVSPKAAVVPRKVNEEAPQKQEEEKRGEKIPDWVLTV